MNLLSLIIDGLLAVLLLAALLAGWRLGRKLDAQAAGRAEIAALAARLATSIPRAEAALAALDARQADLRALGDELAIMTELADDLARRLETAAANARPASPPATAGLAAQVAALEAMRGVR